MTLLKPLSDDEDHAEACHLRWSKRLNRNMDAAAYQDEWYSQQCGSCKYYIRLTGVLSSDYGVCSNSASEFDGRAMFEHDGCERFVYNETIDDFFDNPIDLA